MQRKNPVSMIMIFVTEYLQVNMEMCTQNATNSAKKTRIHDKTRKAQRDPVPNIYIVDGKTVKYYI